MQRCHYIGLDVHCSFTELAVVTQAGRLTKRQRCATTIPALREALQAIARPHAVALEEGPLADWLWRNLHDHVEALTVCDPRRNRLIAKDADKDDPIDAEKLAHLLRGGYLKAVHHPQALERAVFKQLVLLYHDRVRQRVREANRVMAYLRHYGVFVRAQAFADPGERPALLRGLPSLRRIAANLERLWDSYDLAAGQVWTMRRRLVEAARQEEVIERFTPLPGIGWVRAATFFVYVDTPWRFPTKAPVQVPGDRPGASAPRHGPCQGAVGQVCQPAAQGGADGSGPEGQRGQGQPLRHPVPALGASRGLGRVGPP